MGRLFDGQFCPSESGLLGIDKIELPCQDWSRQNVQMPRERKGAARGWRYLDVTDGVAGGPLPIEQTIAIWWFPEMGVPWGAPKSIQIIHFWFVFSI